MAYINFAEPAPQGGLSGPAPAQPASPRFSALEWHVVALARGDGLSSLREPGRLARALGGLFGGGAEARLADPRLEALRRLAVFAWTYGYQLPVSELKAFLRSGFSADQLDMLLSSVAVARAAPKRRTLA